MEYAVALHGDELLHNIELAYDRSVQNADRALGEAAASSWLWGDDASLSDYANQTRLQHQLTGEIELAGDGYRGESYWMCADPIAKELVPEFPGFVLSETQRFLTESLGEHDDRASRIISLDHAKQYALTLFHAAQYPARTRALKPDEEKTISKFGQAAEHATRAFYATVLGWERQWIDDEVLLAGQLLSDQAVTSHAAGLEAKHFKQQELDQPLTVLMSSLLAVEAYPQTDMIFALPAGGTQHAIVTRMLFERKRQYQEPPTLHYLPISTHSAKSEALDGVVSPSIEQVMRQSDPTGHDVLICEDNSNSGTTISLAVDMVTALSPASCRVSIVEFDPKRIEVKNRNLTPLGHVANYAHQDFVTAVGIVPVTTGKYPDAQLRKIIPLRRQRHRNAKMSQKSLDRLTSYDDLPDSFTAKFADTYKDALRHCGDVHGYRNPYQVAASIVCRLEQDGVIEPQPVSKKYGIVQRMAQAAINYPYLPHSVRDQLAAGQESLDYQSDGPWMRSGATGFIDELLKYADESDSQVLIWTKGDGSYYSNPPYAGAEEQQLRFTVSGLERQLKRVGFFAAGRGSFVAHPKKASLLGTRIAHDLRRQYPHISDVVIVDDVEKNLAEASQQMRRFGYVPHPFNPLRGSSGRARLEELTNLARQRVWGSSVSFIVDMDDTLLHEGFRKYHQPRNMGLALLNATDRQ